MPIRVSTSNKWGLRPIAPYLVFKSILNRVLFYFKYIPKLKKVHIAFYYDKREL